MNNKDNNTSVPYRPLGHLLNVVESLQLEVTYAYEDLVFIEHNAFLFRMGEKGEDVFLYFNQESIETQRDALADLIITAGKEHNLNIKKTGLFSMQSKENDQIELTFVEKQFHHCVTPVN